MSDGKRRRMDEDFRDALGNLGVDSGQRGSGVCKLLDVGSERATYDAMVLKAKLNRVIAKASMPCEGVVCMTHDGSNHGTPAESTLMSILWDATTRNGNLAQPIVLYYQSWSVIPKAKYGYFLKILL